MCMFIIENTSRLITQHVILGVPVRANSSEQISQCFTSVLSPALLRILFVFSGNYGLAITLAIGGVFKLL